MSQLSAFAAGTTLLLWFSRKPLRHPGTHGFYRFFAWEAILALLVMNHQFGSENPVLTYQLVSWTLMPLSIVLALLGLATLLIEGRASSRRADHGLLGFERTTRLVTRGVFKYIRHPMYASLLALTWGAYFEDPSWFGVALAAIASGLLFLVARADERECTAYFGQAYVDYMSRTRMFVPFIF